METHFDGFWQNEPLQLSGEIHCNKNSDDVLEIIHFEGKTAKTYFSNISTNNLCIFNIPISDFAIVNTHKLLFLYSGIKPQIVTNFKSEENISISLSEIVTNQDVIIKVTGKVINNSNNQLEKIRIRALDVNHPAAFTNNEGKYEFYIYQINNNLDNFNKSFIIFLDRPGNFLTIDTLFNNMDYKISKVNDTINININNYDITSMSIPHSFSDIQNRKNELHYYVELDSSINVVNGLEHKVLMQPIEFDSIKINYFLNRKDGIFNFQNIIFIEEVNFTNVKFDFPVSFKGSCFLKGAIFYRAVFNGDVNFENVRFNGKVDFSHSNIGGASFKNCYLPENLNFFNSTISKGIDLLFVNRNKWGRCKIDLSFTDISKINLLYDNFILNTSNFDNTLNYSIQTTTYQNLLSKFTNDGKLHSHNLLDREFKEYGYLAKKHETPSLFGKFYWNFRNWVGKYWWGYGYDIEFVLLNTLILFFFFVTINILLLPLLLNCIYENEEIRCTMENISSKHYLKYCLRIPYSIYYTSIIFFIFGFKIDNIIILKQLKLVSKLKNVIGFGFLIIYFFLMYTSGIICIGYLANFVLSGGAK